MNSYITIDGWRSNIRFSSAHIIHEYQKCGRLHGHTYAIHAKVTGKPDSKGIIVDFAVLKEVLREIANDLDHMVLIPKESSIAEVKKEKESVRIKAMDKKFVLPECDCRFLPIKSTSAENLASYILNQVLEKIEFPSGVDCVEIGVDEGYGQGARISKKIK
jgi:6-pyruvoyltetrahydropterin/6-carboxytetrahydropterin synthase